MTVNSFLSARGRQLPGTSPTAPEKRDTGKVDLAAMVDYMAAVARIGPAPGRLRPARRRGHLPPTLRRPASAGGTTVAFDVKSWAMSTAADAKDTEVDRLAGRQEARVRSRSTTRWAPRSYDDYGTAAISVTLPADAPVGATAHAHRRHHRHVAVTVPITTFDRADSVTIGLPNKLIAKKGSAVGFTTILVAEGGVRPTGEVTIYDGKTAIATATLTAKDRGVVKVKLPALATGVTNALRGVRGKRHRPPVEEPDRSSARLVGTKRIP